jgi:hypothetical protein
MTAQEAAANGRLPRIRSRLRNGPGKTVCPAHHDEHPSLTCGESPDGTIVLKCYANCSPLHLQTPQTDSDAD